MRERPPMLISAEYHPNMARQLEALEIVLKAGRASALQDKRAAFGAWIDAALHELGLDRPAASAAEYRARYGRAS